MAAFMIVVAIVAVAAIAAAWWLVTKKRRSDQLRAGFGSEYERTMRATGDRTTAEHELAGRQERVAALHIRSLSADDRTRFGEAWRQAQAHFVDDPGAAVGEADDLIGQVMQARGYPIGDFEQRAADISVDHAEVVTKYRAAHQIAQAQDRGEASTEDLRQALVHYRALFADLLDNAAASAPEQDGQQAPRTTRQEVPR